MTTVIDSLNAGLHRAFTADSRVFLLGEDVLDPYGGAFKATRGLSAAYPDRVLTTPVSEAGFTGVAAGMALRGLRPVVEIMFGDFITLAADQLVNHVAKLRWMYNDRVQVPLVVRTPMGGRRGYGPTHSQTLEKLFLGVPGLQVLAPTTLGDPGALLERVIRETNDPVLFIENKLLYLLPVQDAVILSEFEMAENLFPLSSTGSMGAENRSGLNAPVYTLTLRGAPGPELTITAYGYMAELARQAILKLAYEHEVFAELVVPTCLSPFETNTLFSSLRRTGRLLAVEEGSLTQGWGAEVLARSLETLGPVLRSARRLAAADLPVPASPPLEAAVLPAVELIVEKGLEITGAR